MGTGMDAEAQPGSCTPSSSTVAVLSKTGWESPGHTVIWGWIVQVTSIHFINAPLHRKILVELKLRKPPAVR